MNPEKGERSPGLRPFEKLLLRLFVAAIGSAAGVGLLVGVNELLTVLGLVNLSLLLPAVVVIIYVVVAVGFGVLFYIISPAIIKFIAKVVQRIEKALFEMPLMDLIGGTVGLIIGLVIALLLSGVFERIPIPVLNTVLTVLTYPILAYLGWSVGRRRRSELKGLDSFTSGRKQKGEKAQKGDKVNAAKPKVLDTSVIIDGRIFDICKTGVVEGTLVIPGFVLQELRHVADSADGLKRNRGRRGLDILNKIQRELDIPVKVDSTDYDDIAEVDAKLLQLATDLNGVVITNDYNLNKVAAVQGVPVFNINELANAVKPVVLPGEEMTVTVLKEGKEQGQGVAYLDDGTMIVVDGGRKYMNEQVDVVVTSVLQTAAGRMIFARLK